MNEIWVRLKDCLAELFNIYKYIYIHTIYINMDYYFKCKYENTNLKFVSCAQREKIEHLMLYCKIREGMVIFLYFLFFLIFFFFYL